MEDEEDDERVLDSSGEVQQRRQQEQVNGDLDVGKRRRFRGLTVQVHPPEDPEHGVGDGARGSVGPETLRTLEPRRHHGQD